MFNIRFWSFSFMMITSRVNAFLDDCCSKQTPYHNQPISDEMTHCAYYDVMLYYWIRSTTSWHKSKTRGRHGASRFTNKQGERERRKSSRSVSPLDSVLWLAYLAARCQVGQSQHWIEWADISATLPPLAFSMLQTYSRQEWPCCYRSFMLLEN